MQAIFTIVAKNYLAQARTLGDSVRRHSPDTPFYIFLADECDGFIDTAKETCRIVETRQVGIPRYREMSFKYNVIEFSTAIKPFCFEYMMQEKGYERVIYLDPDIFLYSRIDSLFELLNRYAILMTPHFVTPEISYSGLTEEGLILFVGVYNFGFVGLNNSAEGVQIINWWKSRLTDKCFADKFDGLHVDQKWMDFIPAFFPHDCCIIQDLGCNVAFWNLHERELVTKDGQYAIRHRNGGKKSAALKFVHFAAFDPTSDRLIHKHNPQFPRSLFPEFSVLFADYARLLLANGYRETAHFPYSYATFDNGVTITAMYRRLYRRLLAEGVALPDPFATGSGTFHHLLEQNGLLKGQGLEVDKLNELNYDFSRKLKVINLLCRLLLKVIGGQRYALLMKFLVRYCRYENQINLLGKSLNTTFPLSNENRKKEPLHGTV